MASPITAMTARCLLPSDIISLRFIGVGLSGLSRFRRVLNFNGAATVRQTGCRAQISSGSETGGQTGDAVEAGLAVALDGLAPPPCYLSHANVNFTLVGEGCERTQS